MPPDRQPSRFSSLSSEQKSVIVNFLEFMAFDSNSGFSDQAFQCLTEYWGSNPIFKKNLKTKKHLRSKKEANSPHFVKLHERFNS